MLIEITIIIFIIIITHPMPPISTWPSVETLDMHCTVNEHRRYCCWVLMKNSGSAYSARRARSDSSIRQYGPSASARLCLQHNFSGNNPSLAQELYAEQTSQSSFSVKGIYEQKGENRNGTRRNSVSSALQLLSGRVSSTANEHLTDHVRR